MCRKVYNHFKATEYWNFMKKHKIKPDYECFSNILAVYASTHQKKKADKVFDEYLTFTHGNIDPNIAYLYAAAYSNHFYQLNQLSRFLNEKFNFGSKKLQITYQNFKKIKDSINNDNNAIEFVDW